MKPLALRVFATAFALVAVVPVVAQTSGSAGDSSPQTVKTATEPPCPSTYGPQYFDGTAWKPMTAAVNMKKHTGLSLMGALRDPLNPMGGYTSIRRFQDAAAPITLGPAPRFCLMLPPSVNPGSIFIGSVDVRKDHREVETALRADSWIPAKRLQPIETRRVSNTIVAVTPTKPLQPGQYVLNTPLGIYDFGVDGGK